MQTGSCDEQTLVVTWKVVERTITAVVTCNDRNQCFSDDIWPLVDGISRSFLP